MLDPTGLPTSMFVDGMRFEVFRRGTTIKAYCNALDTWHRATFDASTGSVTPTAAGFPEELRERIERRLAAATTT